MTEPLAGRDLAAFVAAVQAGTVQGAADALSLTQSAATKRIQSLERRLGAALLRRGRTGVRPTEAGWRLYPEACRALAALALAERAVTETPQAEILRIAASHTIGQFLLPDWLTSLMASAPGIRPQVDVVNSPAVLERLRAGEIDLGFVEGTDPLDGFDRVTLSDDEIVAVVAPSHRWAGRSSLRADELTQEPYIAREAGSGTRAVADAALESVGVRLTPAAQLASLESVKRALRGGGFSLMSRLAIDAEAGNRALRALPIADVDMRRRLLAVRRSASAGGPAQILWHLLAGRRPLAAHDE